MRFLQDDFVGVKAQIAQLLSMINPKTWIYILYISVIFVCAIVLLSIVLVFKSFKTS